MNRRFLIAALGAGALIPAATLRTAWAQTAASPPTDSSTAAMASGQQLDAEHVTQTTMVGQLALESSRMALEKAQSVRVKQFAQFEVAEQETMAEVLRTLQEPATTATTTRKIPEDNANPSMTPQAGISADKLSKISGPEFEQQYVALQLDGHNRLLAIQEKLLAGSAPREQIAIAKLARGQIKEHIALLQSIQSDLTPRKG